MEQVKVKMSENCEQVFNALLKGCGITREDINKKNHVSAKELLYISGDNGIPIVQAHITDLIKIMSWLNYEFIHCSTDVLAQLDKSCDLPNEECKELIPASNKHGELQMVFGEIIVTEYDEEIDEVISEQANQLVVFEVSTHSLDATYFIKRITFIEQGANTILFDKNNGFNIQVLPAPTE